MTTPPNRYDCTAAPAARHERDEDCSLGDDGECVVCGVWHGDPCLLCDGRGFHREHCPASDDTAMVAEVFCLGELTWPGFHSAEWRRGGAVVPWFTRDVADALRSALGLAPPYAIDAGVGEDARVLWGWRGGLAFEVRPQTREAER